MIKSQIRTRSQIPFKRSQIRNILKFLIKVVETQGKIVDGQPNCMHTKSGVSEGGAYVEDISDLPKLSDIEDEEKDK